MFHHPDKELKKKRKNYNDNSKSHQNKIEEKTTTGTARYRKYSLCSTVSKSPFWIRRSHLYVQEKKIPHIWKNEVHGATIYIIHVCILQFVVNKWFGGGRIRKKKENERKWQTTAVILIYHRAGPVSAHLFPM